MLVAGKEGISSRYFISTPIMHSLSFKNVMVIDLHLHSELDEGQTLS